MVGGAPDAGLLLTAAAEPVGDLTLIGPIELFGRPPTGTSE